MQGRKDAKQAVIESSKISNSFESKLREVEENEVLKIFMMDYVWPAGPQIRGKVVAKARLMINGAYGIPGDISPEKIKLAVRWLINTCTFTDGDLDIKVECALRAYNSGGKAYKIFLRIYSKLANLQYLNQKPQDKDYGIDFDALEEPMVS
ncbi:hypothetical protein SERLADRAFT_404767 [Serpula lacrymans var. lacrymans S7.9]|uniref:DUF6532 domain-containing protein n=1 Tax=Serpula lacrymans var. lacrymans (strain S7.9) TaxID=578457 RepID=F8NCW9_SERL9|nr:uncharacterized protein SERLADRAFT_404767 [Serpula lacrymans var. lacrymans S7.9]EGO30713.1 hypothetical protein SERLADRAFT_404767 [Serpula lacrymans var. lacrymans S7.9]